MADELYSRSAGLVIATVIDCFTGDVAQDNCPHKYLLEISHVIDRGTGLVDSLFPVLDFLSPGGGEALFPQSILEMFNHSLGDAVEVTISKCGQVYGIGVSL